jgi:hypothetical protein
MYTKRTLLIFLALVASLLVSRRSMAFQEICQANVLDINGNVIGYAVGTAWGSGALGSSLFLNPGYKLPAGQAPTGNGWRYEIENGAQAASRALSERCSNMTERSYAVDPNGWYCDPNAIAGGCELLHR